MKNLLPFAWRQRVSLLIGLLMGCLSLANAQNTIVGTIKRASPATNGVDIYYKPTFSSGTRKFSTVNLCISIPAVSPVPTLTLTPTAAMGGIIMTQNSAAAGGFPVAYNGRLYFVYVSTAVAPNPATFTANTEFKAFNITFSGGTSAQQVQLNDNQVSTNGLGPLGNAQFYMDMTGLGQVTPDPTSGQDPFYANAGESTHGTAVHPASANPLVSPGGTDYQAMPAAAPLPVELTAFTATKQGEDGQLNWATASEKNAAYFEVQASADGHQWQPVGRVEAAGMSSTPRHYALLDKRIARYGAPLVYYRLRQVDADGAVSFSPLRTLAPDAAAWTVTAYPNPFAQDLSAELVSNESSPVTLELYDAAGRRVLHRQVAGRTGLQLVDLRSEGLPTGSYVLHVQQGGHAGTVRLAKE